MSLLALKSHWAVTVFEIFQTYTAFVTTFASRTVPGMLYVYAASVQAASKSSKCKSWWP